MVRFPVALILLAGLQVQVGPLPSVPGQPPRDPVRPPEPTGTAVIKGRVVAADTGNPIRFAMVNLSPMQMPTPPPPAAGAGASTGTTAQGGRGPAAAVVLNQVRPRQATTNGQGLFEFRTLPAGKYRLFVSTSQYSPQYLGMAYGAKQPNSPYMSDPGQAIELADGQSFDKVLIALPRGGVITGRVTDENSEALARVMVYTFFFPPGGGRGQRMGQSSQTDDLGQFRLFGLQPGEHAVVADAMRFNYMPNPNVETEDDRTGYVTTYYPGTPDEASAQRVRVRVATETSGIEFRMAEGRLYRISGNVVDSQGKPLPRINGQVMRRSTALGGNSSQGFNTDDQGAFNIRNVAVGTYRLVIWQTRQGDARLPNGQPDRGEMAAMPITIAGTDLENVMVVTTPGETVTGNVVFEQTSPAPGIAGSMQSRVMAMPGNPEDSLGLPMPQPAVVTRDATFTLKGLLGEILLRASGPNLFLKSVTIGGEDITDTPHEFKSNDRVTITLTSRASTLEGVVADGAGSPTPDAAVILFSEDKNSWRMNSIRTRRTSADADGRFRLNGLMPGHYLVAALPRERLNAGPGAFDARYFEQLSKDATPLVVGEDEQRRMDLKLVSGGQ